MTFDLFGDDAVTPGARQQLRARAYSGRARAHEQGGLPDEAEDDAERALEALREVVVESAETAGLLLLIGRAEHALGRPVAAERRLLEAQAQCERLGLAKLRAQVRTALDEVQAVVGGPLARIVGGEQPPVLADGSRHLDREQAAAVTAIVFAARDAPTPQERRAALAQGLWRFETEFLQALRRIADVYGDMEGLSDDALDLGLQWISGTPLTDRLDEAERRVRFMRMTVAWLGPEHVSPAVLRAVAQALFNLPPGHPERDVAAAYEALLAVSERAKAAGDLDVQLHAAHVLMRYWFELPGDISPLVAEALRALDEFDPGPDPIPTPTAATASRCASRCSSPHSPTTPAASRGRRSAGTTPRQQPRRCSRCATGCATSWPRSPVPMRRTSPPLTRTRPRSSGTGTRR